jgi:hypothetical protein
VQRMIAGEPHAAVETVAWLVLCMCADVAMHPAMPATCCCVPSWPISHRLPACSLAGAVLPAHPAVWPPAEKGRLKVAPWDGYLKYYNLGEKVSGQPLLCRRRWGRSPLGTAASAA